MTDPFIEQVAERERAAARQYLDWMLDRLRVHAGLAEVVDPTEFDEPTRTLRRRRQRIEDELPVNTVRFVPNFDGTGHLIRDVERSA